MQLKEFFLSYHEVFENSFREEFSTNEYSLHYPSGDVLEGLIFQIIRCVDAISLQNNTDIEITFSQFARINLDMNVPFIVSAYQLNFVKDSITHTMLENAEPEHIIYLCKVFDNMSKVISKEYLERYMSRLHEKNTKRQTILDSLLDSSIIEHFHRHLEWLNLLVDAIETKDFTKVPEQEPTHCFFGQWMHHEGETIIHDEFLKNDIHHTHNDLHLTARVIYQLLKKDELDYHKVYIYLQKAELYSINIGNSLALVSNVILNTVSSKDTLTGVLNRKILDKILKTQINIAKATETCFSIAMADLDYFKKVNDKYGHVAGDKVLKMFAELLKSELRESDFIFRYGGEEFLMILPATRHKEAIQVMEKIREKLEQQVCTCLDTQASIKLTASFGIHEVCPELMEKVASTSINYYIQKADEQLYTAKHSGRNCVR